jgi:hypothetical protein
MSIGEGDRIALPYTSMSAPYEEKYGPSVKKQNLARISPELIMLGASS